MRYLNRSTRLLRSLMLILILSACTAPSSPPAGNSVGGPTPPIGARVLVPTATSVAVAQPPTSAPATEQTTVVTQNAEQSQEQLAAADSPLTAEQAALLAKLPSRGAAPELHNETWFNSEPLKLADLRGKVVMVEFWTYG